MLEFKTIRKSRSPETVLWEALEQISRCADRSNAGESHLVIRDERPEPAWDEKIYERAERRDGRDISVWGL